MKRVLVTTTSFQDTPGNHHDLLASTGWEILTARGPLNEDQILALVGDVDALICGDDMITRKVLEKARPRLRIISKYGIGVDKIDVNAATEMGVPVLFTPGVNHTTVAEHSFLLMLALAKHLPFHIDATRKGEWKRKTGNEIWGKTIAVLGMGRIGKEVAVRARAFGMTVLGYDLYWDAAFAEAHQVERVESLDALWPRADVISLHVNLSAETRDLVCASSISKMKNGVVLINCARGEIVHTGDVVAGLDSGQIGGYGTDVLDVEPPDAAHPLLRHPRCIVTPHVGSRTYESVLRQATMCVENLRLAMAGNKPLAQVNQIPIPPAV